jgi:hypothetical protein
MAASYVGQHPQKARGPTAMPWMGFEPTMPVFELTNESVALDGATAVVGIYTTTPFGADECS